MRIPRILAATAAITLALFTTVAVGSGAGAVDYPPKPLPLNQLGPEWSFSVNGFDPNDVHPGDGFTLTGGGLPSGTVVAGELHSTPISLGSTVTGASGEFSLGGAIPSDIPLGTHTIVLSLSGGGLEPTTRTQSITVVALPGGGVGIESTSVDEVVVPPAAPAEASDVQLPTEAVPGQESELGGEEGHGESALDPSSQPNILTDALDPILEVITDPGRVSAAFAAGLVLLIFAIMPAHLLNATIAEQYPRFARRMPRLTAQPRWYLALRAAFDRAPVLGGLILTTTTALLFAFADPHFGPTLASLRLFLALAGALFTVTYFANAITGLIVRRAWNVDVVVTMRPLGLLLTVVGVIASRVLDFSPGFLIGLVLGLTITSKAASRYAWKAVLVRVSVIVTFALVAWIAYSSMADGVHHDPTFTNELLLELLVAIATEGIVMLLVEMLPFHLLEGERLYKRSRVLWGAVYTVLLTIFLLAVIPWEGNWRELGESFWPWLTAVAIFGAVCVSVYLYFRFLASPIDHTDHGDEDATVDDHDRISIGNDS